MRGNDLLKKPNFFINFINLDERNLIRPPFLIEMLIFSRTEGCIRESSLIT